MTLAMTLKQKSLKALTAGQLLLIAVIVVAGATVFSSDTQAQSIKIGYLDDQKVLFNYDAWNKAKEQFETEMKAWEDEANRMMQNFIQDSVEYEKQKLILSKERRTERLAEISAKRTAVDAFTKDVFGQNGQADRKNTTLTKPLLDNMMTAVRTVASEGNYDVIFNSSALAYINPAYDITDKIIEALANEG
jgi:outer membrane protein